MRKSYHEFILFFIPVNFISKSHLFSPLLDLWTSIFICKPILRLFLLYQLFLLIRELPFLFRLIFVNIFLNILVFLCFSILFTMTVDNGKIMLNFSFYLKLNWASRLLEDLIQKSKFIRDE